MDRHRIELQIRAVLVTFRGEQRRHDSDVMEQFRARARQLLDEIEPQVRGNPSLKAQLAAARAEIARRSPSAPLPHR